MLFNHITIVGVGLIGGSFALAAKQAGAASRITGWGGSSASLETAQSLGMIDGVENAFDSGQASDADLIYLAAPVGGIIEFLRTQGNSIKPGAIVTDAGSAKREICRTARESLSQNVHFVGGHPMAGSHKTGVEFANGKLFQGAPYAIMIDEPDGEYTDAARPVIELVKAIGSRPVLLTPEQHDRAVAIVSHAPQLLSSLLAVTLARKGNKDALDLAGSGIAEMLRLAESRWSVWEDIFRANADMVAIALAELIRQIETAHLDLEAGNFNSLREVFLEANLFMSDFRGPGREET